MRHREAETCCGRNSDAHNPKPLLSHPRSLATGEAVGLVLALDCYKQHHLDTQKR